MRNRVAVVAVLCLVFAAGIGAVSLIKKSGPAVISADFQEIGTNIQQSELIDNELFFFTGSSFAKFDIKTGKTTALSSYFYTPGVVTVQQWSKKSVLFSTNGNSTTDIFGLAVGRSINNPTSHHWWRYDFTTNQLQLLDFKGASACKWVFENNSKLYCIAPALSSNHNFVVSVYDLGTSEHTELTRIDKKIDNAELKKGKLYLSETAVDGTSSITSLDLQTHNTNPLYKGRKTLGFVSDGTYILAAESPSLNGVSQNKREHDANSGGYTVLYLIDSHGVVVQKMNIGSVDGQLSDDSGTLEFVSTNGTIYMVGGSHISASAIAEGGLVYLWEQGSDFYYVDGENNIFSNRNVTEAKNGKDFDESENTAPNTFYVNNEDSSKNTVYINDSSLDFSQNAAGVASWLTTRGYDPNQFYFNWEIIPTLDESTAASQVVIIR